MKQLLFGRQFGLGLRRDLADEDIARFHVGTDPHDAALVEVAELLFADVGNVARELLTAELGLADFDVEFMWSLINSKQLEAWNGEIRFIEEWCILDYHKERWRWIAPFAHVPAIRMFLGDKIVRVRL